MPRIEDIARTTAERHVMFPPQAPVVVMVSGGADSVSLAHLVASGALGSLRVKVLHVNHLLRGDDADEDEAFVRDLAGRLGVELALVRYDVAAYAAAEGLNLEDAGRRVRYRFAEDELDAWCAMLGEAPEHGRIAVAHSLDDRIETFFMRAIAGSGTGALGSIAPVRGRIVRPLLQCERADLRAFLREAGESWREDESNYDVSRARALVRTELLPAAEKLNPSFRASMARTMDLLADDDGLLTSMAQAFARDFAEHADGEVRFDRSLMSSLERTMARRTVRCALSDAFPEASRLEAEHVEALVEGLGNDRFSHSLPMGLRAFAEYGTMVVSRMGEDPRTVAPGLLLLPGTVALGPAGSIRAELVDRADTIGGPDSVVVDVGDDLEELTVDGPRSGDRMRPIGMAGSRKLSDLLIDAKVPRRARGATPVVRDGENIVWLAGVRMSEDYRITADTVRAVRLTWQRPNDG